VFQLLATRLKTSFKHVAAVDLRIKTRQPKVTDEKISDYWQLAVVRSNISSPAVSSILNNNVPAILNKVVTLTLSNEITKNLLKDNYLAILQQSYLVLGFPEFQIQLDINKEASELMHQEY